MQFDEVIIVLILLFEVLFSMLHLDFRSKFFILFCINLAMNCLYNIKDYLNQAAKWSNDQERPWVFLKLI